LLTTSYYKGNCQVIQKKLLTEADYNLWGNLQIDKISENGNWVSFSMTFDDGKDTLYVRNTQSEKEYYFTNAQQGKFLKEKSFAFLDYSKKLHVLDLKRGIVNKYENINAFYFIENSECLVTETTENNLKLIQIWNLKGELLNHVNNITEYKFSPSGKLLAFIEQIQDTTRIVLYNFTENSKHRLLAENGNGKYFHLIWSDTDDKALACLKESNNYVSNSIFYHSIEDNISYHFEPESFSDFPNEFVIENGYQSRLTLSRDGKNVIFIVSRRQPQNIVHEDVQVWNCNDAIVYSEKMRNDNILQNTKTLVWIPKSNIFRLITDENLPHVFFNATKDYAVTYNVEELGIQYTENPNVNYYVLDLENGIRNMIVSNQSTDLKKSGLSPQGNYFAYFNNNNWLIYDFKKSKAFGIPQNSLFDSDKSNEIWPRPFYGIAGWGKNDEYLLLYDQYDIWEYNFDKKKLTRITNGREKELKYRVVTFKKGVYSGLTEKIDAVVDLADNLVLRGTKGNDTGYFVRLPNGKIEKIVFDSSLNNSLKKANKENRYVYLSQKYDCPPELRFFELHNKSKITFFKSNKHHYKYLWGKQEIIDYKNSKGNNLKGLLYYPANFDSLQKHPMVVSIYEDQNYMQHYYFNPTMYNTAGLNIPALTAQGYFVLLPDIEYELGEPGMSATDCVLTAVRKVIDKGFVNENKIALIGQSFGGYETNFIVTQTDVFCTAISSASVFNIESWYLSISENTGVPEIWRFEKQQWRMGKSLFDDRESYRGNSPFNYVEKISIPLLLWTGENDKQINPKQSISFYLALRRMQKKGVLLVYPKETHSLVLKQNQIDLYNRVRDWLAYFLKGEKSDWVNQAIN